MIPDELMRAIIANKSDDLPRLIAADWLDDHGESERAEFIRVQCELAKVGKCSYTIRGDRSCFPPWCKECRKIKGGRNGIDRLCQIQRELLSTYRLKWTQGIPGPPPHVRAYDWVTFSRGFVSTITCSWQDWLTYADAILKATPLEVVALTTWPDYEMYADVSANLTDNIFNAMGRRWPGIMFELIGIGGINHDMDIPWRSSELAAH